MTANGDFNIKEEMTKNYDSVRNFLNGSTQNCSNNEQINDEYIFVSNNINLIPNTNSTADKRILQNKDIGVDTLDLIEDNSFNFDVLKNNYLNYMVSWTFLKKISDFNKWPLGCIANFVENSLKSEIESKNIYIDSKFYNKYVFTEGIENNDSNDKILLLSIIDDGKGISNSEFNKMFYSFSINEKKERNFVKYGLSMKSSAIRLANSFLVITKHKNEASIGLISKSLQIKMDTESILTPIVNFYIETIDGANKYIPKSNYAKPSLNLILNEIRFLFKQEEDFHSYLDSFAQGTHIFLYDLRQISSDKSQINKLSNFELLFDYENCDILYNYFSIQICKTSYLDCSLKQYLRLFNLRSSNTNIQFFGNKINSNNPLMAIYNQSSNYQEATKISTNLKCDNIKKSDAVYFNGEIYKGLIYNENYLKNFATFKNYDFENLMENNDLFNGILVYRSNRLICRFGQNSLGDISYFIKKYIKHEDGNIFKSSGFIEVPESLYEVLNTKTVNIF